MINLFLMLLLFVYLQLCGLFPVSKLIQFDLKGEIQTIFIMTVVPLPSCVGNARDMRGGEPLHRSSATALVNINIDYPQIHNTMCSIC